MYLRQGKVELLVTLPLPLRLRVHQRKLEGNGNAIIFLDSRFGTAAP